MNHYEKVKTLFTELEIPISEAVSKDKKTITLSVDDNRDNNKIEGYSPFFTEFIFDENGKFIKVGIWE